MIGAVINAHTKSMDTVGATRYIDLAGKLNISLSVLTLNSLINVYAEKGDKIGAVEWYYYYFLYYYYDHYYYYLGLKN